MPLYADLTAATSWRSLSTTSEDWNAADPALLATMLTSIQFIRSFEEKVPGPENVTRPFAVSSTAFNDATKPQIFL